MKNDYVQTPFGKRAIVRRVGVQGEYYQTINPRTSDLEWWVMNLQRGLVATSPSQSRALRAALTEVA
jgi:hypothetical protein